MNKIHKNIWLIGHTLSRKGLIDAVCQMRDVANAWHNDGYDGKSEAIGILDRLYHKDKFIDEALWQSLRGEVKDASKGH